MRSEIVAAVFVVGLVIGATTGTFAIGWGIWEEGKRVGLAIARHDIPLGLIACERLLLENDMNKIQADYCAELVAQVLDLGQ